MVVSDLLAGTVSAMRGRETEERRTIGATPTRESKDRQSSFCSPGLPRAGSRPPALLLGESFFPRLEPGGKAPAQFVKSSPTGGSFQSYMLFLLSINSAKESILITNPYFIPDNVMTEALVKAVGRGVRVMVFAPGKIDSQLTYTVSRGSYGPLLFGGVQIFEYQAGLLHAKTMVVDGVWATIGSTNFDNRSFALNQEINLTVYDRAVASRLEETFREDLNFAKQVSYAEWESRGIHERLIDLFSFPVKDQL
jgi:cardiolipin synthase